MYPISDKSADASSNKGATTKAKEIFAEFLATLDKIKKDHRERINLVLKNVDERKIKILKEKLKNL